MKPREGGKDAGILIGRIGSPMKPMTGKQIKLFASDEQLTSQIYMTLFRIGMEPIFQFVKPSETSE
jgi:hypothetical protein